MRKSKHKLMQKRQKKKLKREQRQTTDEFQFEEQVGENESGNINN